MQQPHQLRSPRVRPSSGLDDGEVEESIEYVEDTDEAAGHNGLLPNHSGLHMTRHTRSHFDLHSKKQSGLHGGHSRTQTELRRGPAQPRVPLQPRVSTPPCVSSRHEPLSGGGAGSSSGGNSWGSGGQRSCSCLSPSGTYASTGAPRSKPRQPAALRPEPHRDSHRERELRVAGVSPSARTFWQLPSSPVRALRGSAESSVATPPSPDALLVPGSPTVGLGFDHDGFLETSGMPPPADTLPFEELQRVVGFPGYYAEEERYRVAPPSK